MNTAFRYALSSGLLLFLGACGGGSSSGDGDVPSGGVPLSFPEDAMREFALAGLVLNTATDNLPDPEATSVAPPKALGGGRWGRLPTGLADDAPQPPKATCPEGGDLTIAPGNKNFSFDFFGRSAAVEFQRETDTNCRFASQISPTQVATLELHGVFEHGRSGQFGDGLRLGYLVDGAGSPHTTTYQVRENGRVVYEERTRVEGRSQFSAEAGGGTEVRAVHRYQYNDSEGFTALVAVGEGSQPFRGRIANQTLSLDGVYGYKTSICSGGVVTATTQQLIAISDDGYPVGGRLRIDSGEKSAVFTFNADGSASLNLNGVTHPVSRAQVEAAVDSEPC